MAVLRRHLIPILLVVLIAAASYGLDARAQQRDQDQRRANRAAFAESDRRLCENGNQIRLAMRIEENESYARLRQTLKLLRVPPTPEVLALARRNHERKLYLYRARNCSALPSQ